MSEEKTVVSLSDVQFAAFVERTKQCSQCKSDTTGKGSIGLYSPLSGKRVPFSWNHKKAKFDSYIALCKSCGSAFMEQHDSKPVEVAPGVDLKKAIFPPNPVLDDVKMWSRQSITKLMLMYREAWGLKAMTATEFFAHAQEVYFKRGEDEVAP